MNSLEYKEKLNTFIESMSRYLPKEKRDIAMIYFEMGALWGRRALAEKNGVTNEHSNALRRGLANRFFLTVKLNDGIITSSIGKNGLSSLSGRTPEVLFDSEDEAMEAFRNLVPSFKVHIQEAKLYYVNQDNKKELVRIIFNKDESKKESDLKDNNPRKEYYLRI